MENGLTAAMEQVQNQQQASLGEDSKLQAELNQLDLEFRLRQEFEQKCDALRAEHLSSLAEIQQQFDIEVELINNKIDPDYDKKMLEQNEEINGIQSDIDNIKILIHRNELKIAQFEVLLYIYILFCFFIFFSSSIYIIEREKISFRK